MELNELLSVLAQFALVGAVASIVVQYIKATFATSPAKTRLAVLVLSVLGGVGFYFVKDMSWLPAAIGVLASINTVYLYLIKPFET